MHENESGGGPVLRVKGIDKSFGAVQALKDVELEVRRGEVLALIGDNGAGKSTLINVITGVLEPDSGEIVFEGEDRRRGQGHGYQRQAGHLDHRPETAGLRGGD
jgi:ABC-type sugar transport system ATPase subunit